MKHGFYISMQICGQRMMYYILIITIDTPWRQIQHIAEFNMDELRDLDTPHLLLQL